jgi:hypothetical protein
MQNSSNGSKKNDYEIVQIQDCDGFEIKIPKEEIDRFIGAKSHSKKCVDIQKDVR